MITIFVEDTLALCFLPSKPFFIVYTRSCLGFSPPLRNTYPRNPTSTLELPCLPPRIPFWRRPSPIAIIRGSHHHRRVRFLLLVLFSVSNNYRDRLLGLPRNSLSLLKFNEHPIDILCLTNCRLCTYLRFHHLVYTYLSQLEFRSHVTSTYEPFTFLLNSHPPSTSFTRPIP
jgi:hypothetical protein